MTMTTIDERIANLEKNLALAHEALLAIREMLKVQNERIENLEDFMHMLTGEKPNPYVGVPPND